jgi:hypothetical protein
LFEVSETGNASPIHTRNPIRASGLPAIEASPARALTGFFVNAAKPHSRESLKYALNHAFFCAPFHWL